MGLRDLDPVEWVMGSMFGTIVIGLVIIAILGLTGVLEDGEKAAKEKIEQAKQILAEHKVAVAVKKWTKDAAEVEENQEVIEELQVSIKEDVAKLEVAQRPVTVEPAESAEKEDALPALPALPELEWVVEW